MYLWRCKACFSARKVILICWAARGGEKQPPATGSAGWGSPPLVLNMKMRYSQFVYVGDYGTVRISDKTVRAYGVEFLTNGDSQWRRSSVKRAKVNEFNAALAAINKYRWLRGEEAGEI